MMNILYKITSGCLSTHNLLHYHTSHIKYQPALPILHQHPWKGLLYLYKYRSKLPSVNHTVKMWHVTGLVVVARHEWSKIQKLFRLRRGG